MVEQQRSMSPDGRFQLVLVLDEMRMSHWLEQPVLTEGATGETLLDLTDSLWSVDRAAWSDDSRYLTLEMRRYPGDVPDVTVELAVLDCIARVNTPAGKAAIPLRDLPAWLEWNNRRAS